jgi:hypothetical protein
LREFTHGHGLQLASVARAHLLALAARTRCLPGIGEQAYVDIDSLLRPVFGHAKAGASFGHTKIAGKQVLRRGLSPLATTISTNTAAPLIAGVRLRAGRAGSGKGAASMVREAIRLARAAGGSGKVLVRGDSAYGSAAVITATLREGAQFSLILAKHPGVVAAIATITDDAWTPVHYPGAVIDPDTGTLISDAQVAEVTYTAFASTKTPVTARLVVRRVRDVAKTAELFPVWRHHPFFTNSGEATAQADITHRRHAVIETVFADLIDGPLAHLPSGVVPGEHCLGHLRADRPQPAARRRSPGQPRARRRPRRHRAHPDRQRPGPPGPPATQGHPSPARALALGAHLDPAMAPGLHPRQPPTATDLTPTTPSGPTGTDVEELDRPAAQTRPTDEDSNNRHQHQHQRSTTKPLHGSRLSVHGERHAIGFACTLRRTPIPGRPPWIGVPPASYRLPEAGIGGEDEGVRLPETVRRIASCTRDPIQTSPKAPASSTGWRAQ